MQSKPPELLYVPYFTVHVVLSVTLLSNASITSLLHTFAASEYEVSLDLRPLHSPPCTQDSFMGLCLLKHI